MTGAERDTLVRSFFDAFGQRDPDAMDALLAEDFRFHVVWSANLPEPMTREVALGFYRTVCQWDSGPFSTFAFRVDDVVVHPFEDGAGAAVEYQSDAIWRETGHRYENSYIGLFRFAGGKISEWREYFDPGVVSASMAGQLDTPA